MTDKKLSTEPYKGVRDFYPKDMAIREYIFDIWTHVAESFGFERYDASVLEPAEIYRAKTGEEIVNEQTYTFTDRGDREVTLRPEMTPTVARMVSSKRRELSFPLRWYSIPNLFRYERPQRGRLREHWQLNCDIFGTDTVAADAEVIALAYHTLIAFGATEADFTILVNDRQMLNEYFASLQLTDEQTHHMYKLLDRKTKISESEFEAEAAAILGRPYDAHELESLSSERLATCTTLLREIGITNVSYSPSIVRGFDYYNGIVFEIFDTDPQNNRSLFGGGRYDNLTELFGDESIPAVGFGVGDVTMHDFLETHGLLPELHTGPRVMLLMASDNVTTETFAIREELRRGAVSAAIDFSGKKLGDQIARADKRGIPYVIVVGDDEVAAGVYTLRRLETGEEMKGAIPDLIAGIS